jgi:myo-inositol-1(or 4)-monophosphatase
VSDRLAPDESSEAQPGERRVRVAGLDAGALMELRDLAADAAVTAGLLLLESFAEDAASHEVTSKSTPTDLVSEADRAAERAIREQLARERPRDGFLGEEGGDSAGDSGLRWVVDPLDGTVNFLFGIPQWCVSVAVQDGAGSLVGAIYDAVRGDLFTAVRGTPPTVQGHVGSQPRRAIGPSRPPEPRTLTASRRSDLSTAMVATGLAYDARVRAAQARVLTRTVPHVRDIRRFGSAALDLAWTAAGRYDAYFERTVKPWDIAAGTLLCEAAGLRVVELPVHEDLPWGILVAPPALCEPLLELVGGPA